MCSNELIGNKKTEYIKITFYLLITIRVRLENIKFAVGNHVFHSQTKFRHYIVYSFSLRVK